MNQGLDCSPIRFALLTPREHSFTSPFVGEAEHKRIWIFFGNLMLFSVRWNQQKFSVRAKKGDDGQKSSWVGFGVCDVNRKRNVRLKEKSGEHCIINTHKAGGDFALATRSVDCWWARRDCCWWTSLLSEKNRFWHWKIVSRMLFMWLLFTPETIRNHRHPSFTNM